MHGSPTALPPFLHEGDRARDFPGEGLPGRSPPPPRNRGVSRRSHHSLVSDRAGRAEFRPRQLLRASLAPCIKDGRAGGARSEEPEARRVDNMSANGKPAGAGEGSYGIIPFPLKGTYGGFIPSLAPPGARAGAEAGRRSGWAKARSGQARNARRSSRFDALKLLGEGLSFTAPLTGELEAGAGFYGRRRRGNLPASR